MKSILLGLALTSTLSFSACRLNTNPGTGEKIGQVIRLNHSGFLCKTWEAQLLRGGMTDGSGSIGGAPFDFTIEDEKVAAQVQEYMANQTEVVIKYRMETIFAFCRSSSEGHFLESIAPSKVLPEATK